MTASIATFAEALSDYLNSCAYFTYDRKYELHQDVSDAQLDAANVIVKLGQDIGAAPEQALQDTRHWLGLLGKDEFELQLYASVHQIEIGVFLPSNAADYLVALNSALTTKYGTLKIQADRDHASANVLQFCNRDRDELDATE